MDLLDNFDFTSIDEYLRYKSDTNISFTELLKMIISGDIDTIFRQLLIFVYNVFIKEIHDGLTVGVKIIIIGILSGLFVLMAKSFNSNYIAEIGSYISFITMSALILMFYKNAFDIGYNVIIDTKDFVLTLIPTLILAISMCSGPITTISYFTLINVILEIIDSIFIYIVMPVINIFVVSHIITNSISNNKLTYITKVMNSGIKTIIKICITIISGMSVIKIMILPFVDNISESTTVKTLKAIPGVGDSISGVLNLLAGSATLIRNSIGACGILCIIVLVATPIIKLIALSLLIKLVTTLIVGISDIKVINLCLAVDEGINLILKTTFASISILFIGISVICLSINI